MFELTSDEPFVFVDQEGLLGAFCVFFISKLDQDVILAIEDNKPYPFILNAGCNNNFDFDDLLVCREVKAFVVIVISACSACFPITQSKTESVKTVRLITLNPGDGQVSELLQGHSFNLIYIREYYLASYRLKSGQAAISLED